MRQCSAVESATVAFDYDVSRFRASVSKYADMEFRPEMVHENEIRPFSTEYRMVGQQWEPWQRLEAWS